MTSKIHLIAECYNENFYHPIFCEDCTCRDVCFARYYKIMEDDYDEE